MKIMRDNTLQHFSTSALQHFSTSALQHFSTSALQHSPRKDRLSPDRQAVFLRKHISFFSCCFTGSKSAGLFYHIQTTYLSLQNRMGSAAAIQNGPYSKAIIGKAYYRRARQAVWFDSVQAKEQLQRLRSANVSIILRRKIIWKSTYPDASVGVCCSHKVVAVGFNTLRYDASVGVLNPPHE